MLMAIMPTMQVAIMRITPVIMPITRAIVSIMVISNMQTRSKIRTITEDSISTQSSGC